MAAFEITFVNVGHGDATLIKLPGERYVLVVAEKSGLQADDVEYRLFRRDER